MCLVHAFSTLIPISTKGNSLLAVAQGKLLEPSFLSACLSLCLFHLVALPYSIPKFQPLLITVTTAILLKASNIAHLANHRSLEGFSASAFPLSLPVPDCHSRWGYPSVLLSSVYSFAKTLPCFPSPLK